MVRRTLFDQLKDRCYKGETLLLTGARQTGKSTLLHAVAQSFGDYLFLDGDDPFVRQQMDNIHYEGLKQLIGNYKLVLIDEAQRINHCGLTLKMIHDRFKEVQLLVSGSSALDLGNNLNEPLTGRKLEYRMYPISWEEWQDHTDFLTVQQQLESRLIYGMYPDVLNHPGEEERILPALTSSYLYKDIFMLTGIKKPDVLERLVQALALQCGSEVSYNELAQLLHIDKNTVSTYIDLLEKTYLIFRLPAYSGNLRNEIKQGRKIYFYDNGIRNAVINNFNPLSLREDKGTLWENFLVSERMKYNDNHGKNIRSFFWRNRQQQEIDYIEEKAGKLSAFEIKWKKKSGHKFPASFVSGYNATFDVIDNENFTGFVIY